jgi:hypothetical protein
MKVKIRWVMRSVHTTAHTLLLVAVIGVAPAAATPVLTVSPAPPTGWLSGGEYPITAMVTSERPLSRFGWSIEGAGSRFWTNYCLKFDPCEMPSAVTYVLRPAEIPDGVRNLTFFAEHPGTPVGHHIPTVEARQTFQLRIDHSAPAAPHDLRLVGDGGWRARNEFAIRWTRVSPDSGTPFVGATYRICPAANLPIDSAGCIMGEREGSELDSITGITVPGTGVWRLQLALEDAMGHLDLSAGATIDDLRLDLDSPSLAFLPRDPGDPARIQLSVSDEGAGLASVAIEARRRGEDTWRALSVSASQGRLTALLDDDSLPAGSYEVRGHAIDAVGNQRTLALPGAESIQLPVRGGSKLAAGVPRSARRTRTRALDTRPSVRFGAHVPIHGRVTDAFGTGRANVSVEVSERLALPSVAWRRITTLTTDDNGTFRYTAPRGVARTIRFQYAGTPTARPAASEVALRVRAASTLRPSRRMLRNGESVVLRGRLLGRPVPSTGKLVTVQAWTSRGWLTFGNARARAKDGKWSYRYTFTGTTTTSRYRFRALVPQEESYPYVTGVSPVKGVVVRGLR